MVRNFYNSNENSNVFVRGFRCYGTDINNTSIIFINGLHSWTNAYMMDFLESNLKEFNKYILSVKRSMCSRGWYFRIKVLSSDFKFDDFKKKFVSYISNASLSYSNCTHYIRKRSLQQIRNQLFSSSTNFNDSINNQSNSTTNFNDSINNQSNSTTTSSQSNTSDSFQRNSLVSIHSNLNTLNSIKDKFTFCLSWNTNGWNHEKKDSIEYFITLFKPLFLCFQETKNGSGANSSQPCKVTIPNYRYFVRRAVDSIPGMRGLFLGYHKSCQAILEENSFNYIISLTNYNIYDSKCSVGNVYIPVSSHSTQVKCALAEVIDWLNIHRDHASILVGDFNMKTVDLEEKISQLMVG
ncbi:hypothetical protein BCR32DRAFT_287089 [Anaeromyces robustus]|uniref:DNase I-like protein n=1 Tax=Anaeromyces robustus TaxID=1754192 RepID=A0A1Y1VTW4_9FUNG|nr:hypothetical protein BCR32DRAFT_287089 [Anaeromyces robustus]|eukprot:ORX64455.1 hypothetical protein BCR32DRAFT_287089 [Anaeromyces robustus]